MASRKKSDNKFPTHKGRRNEPDGDNDFDLTPVKEESTPWVIRELQDMDKFYTRFCSGCQQLVIVGLDPNLTILKVEAICGKCGNKVTGSVANDKDDMKRVDKAQTALI